MTESFSHRDPDNTYVIDAESGAEMARLIDQDRIATRAMGGLFSERDDLSTIFDVLDIGCGPGGWVLDVAHHYRHRHQHEYDPVCPGVCPGAPASQRPLPGDECTPTPGLP